jgi:hypothetical protein
MHSLRLLQSLPALAAATLAMPWLPAEAALDGDAFKLAADEAGLHSLMVWQRGALVLQQMSAGRRRHRFEAPQQPQLLLALRQRNRDGCAVQLARCTPR